MRRLKLYLETSVWNYHDANDTPEKRDITRYFLANWNAWNYELYIGETVIEEIEDASPERQRTLLSLIESVRPRVLALEGEVAELAAAYLAAGALPARARADATHVAFGTVFELDAVVSWNMRHIANLRRQESVHAVNLANGYTKPPQLITPFEVSNYEDA